VANERWGEKLEEISKIIGNALIAKDKKAVHG